MIELARQRLVRFQIASKRVTNATVGSWLGCQWLATIISSGSRIVVVAVPADCECNVAAVKHGWISAFVSAPAVASRTVLG
jgi:hypothetical protein